MAYQCPICGQSFTIDDVHGEEIDRACFILNEHGMSIRAISRLFGWHPESVRFRLNRFRERHNL